MVIADIISGIVNSVANGFKYFTGRSELNNSPEMQANAAAATRQKIADDANAAVAKGDLSEERKEGAEQ